MADRLKIIVPNGLIQRQGGSKRTVNREMIEIDRYELILLRPRKEDGDLRFGVITDIEEVRRKQQIILRPSYVLGKFEELGGRDVTLIGLSSKKNLVLESFKEVVVGKDSIVDRLEDCNGYSHHANWINKLIKPYLRD